MRRYIPIFISIVIVLVSFITVYQIKNSHHIKIVENIGSFTKTKNCIRYPQFLYRLKIPQPIAIDLSQQHYKGFAFLFGDNLQRAIHIKEWENFDYFGGYALDRVGDMYLAPMPFISVKTTTFNLQKNIYRLDSQTAKLTIWKTIDEVKASSNNPFGIIYLVYDCDDNSLWVSAIDESDYFHSRGVIYHIDIASKQILQRLHGVDALSLQLIYTQKGKYLLAGLANQNSLIAYKIEKDKLLDRAITLLKLPNSDEHIRKIFVVGQNLLRLQTISFSYNLIAQTNNEHSIRRNYNAIFDSTSFEFKLIHIR